MSKIFIIIEYFYSSIEVELNPAITGKPIVITYDGIIVGISEISKKLSRVRPGMPESYARENFPELLYVKGDMVRYRDLSRELAVRLQIYAYTVSERKPGVYILDIDGCPFNRWSKSMKEERLSSLLEGKHFRGGQSVNIDIAEIAAKKAMTNSLKIISPGEEEYFMASLPVSYLPLTRFGIQSLREMGIAKIGDMMNVPEPVIIELLGKDAKRIINFIKGNFGKKHNVPNKLSKSIRFARNNDRSEQSILNSAVVSLVETMMNDRVKASSIFIGLQYVDGVTIGRKLRLSPTRDEVEISRARDFLLAQIWKRRTQLETGLIKFTVGPDNGQMSLLDDTRRNMIADSVHTVRGEYSVKAIKYARFAN